MTMIGEYRILTGKGSPAVVTWMAYEAFPYFQEYPSTETTAINRII